MAESNIRYVVHMQGVSIMQRLLAAAFMIIFSIFGLELLSGIAYVQEQRASLRFKRLEQ